MLSVENKDAKLRPKINKPRMTKKIETMRNRVMYFKKVMVNFLYITIPPKYITPSSNCRNHVRMIWVVLYFLSQGPNVYHQGIIIDTSVIAPYFYIKLFFSKQLIFVGNNIVYTIVCSII